MKKNCLTVGGALENETKANQVKMRFLRAYFYFNLARAYGDVPLITKVLTEDEANQVTRTPVADVFDFIVKECDAILEADQLPVRYSDLVGDAANGSDCEQGALATAWESGDDERYGTVLSNGSGWW